MGKALVAACAVFAAVGGFLFGYDSGIISSTIAQPKFIEYFGALSDAQDGGVVSSFQGGAIVGCLTVTYFGDMLGRKRMIFLASILALFGSALQGGAATVGMLIAGRLFAGIAVGQLSSTVPVYCAEIAPPNLRGLLSGLQQWMLSWGFFAAQWIGYGATHSTSALQWRFPLAFQVLPALLLTVGILFLPESPRWLVEKDRQEEARATLHRLHSTGDNVDFIVSELVAIQDEIQRDRQNRQLSSMSILTKPSWRRRLLLGCGIQAFGQLSGINVNNYYAPRIYKSLGIDTSGALMITGINGSLGIVENTIILLLIDRIGRILPLSIGAFGMSSSMLIVAILNQYFPADSPHTNGNALRAQVAMSFVFQLFFQPLGSISWIYPAEIFPTEIRALGAAISTTSNWCLNLLFAQCSPIALGQIGFKYFYLFFAFNFISMFVFMFLYPETKQRTLEEIDALFERSDRSSATKEDGPDTGDKPVPQMEAAYAVHTA
ncbi:sugar transporter [Aspergillus pseudoustus]|uniref:Sugar transporter n=1 Tax=Aspergillus pseudoustus TaxID=1810923 RepID=A0ABR4K6Q5_9EURO